MTIKGTVSKVEWMNPHARFYVDVKDDTGAVTTWNLELASPNVFVRNGWTKRSLSVGDEITVEGSAAKDGSKMGNARVVRLADGRGVFAGSSGGDAAPAAAPAAVGRKGRGMSMRVWYSTLALAAAGLVAVSAQQTPPAATSPAGSGGLNRAPAAPAGPVKRLPNGEVDLSGVWQGGGPVGNIADGLKKGETLPIRPEWKAIMDARMSKDDPEANCLPTGVPRRDPYPWRIVQTPTHTKSTHVFMLFEGNIHSYRQIFMDGRKHPADPDPTWYGHSVGRWEGDTLVVDTVGFNDRFWFDFIGTPHTEKLHTVERYRRTNEGTRVIETVVDDPGAYTRPFTITFTARLRPNEELTEYICNENNQDVSYTVGPAKEF